MLTLFKSPLSGTTEAKPKRHEMKNGSHCSLTGPLGKHPLLVVAPGIYFSLLPGSQDLPALAILLAHCSTQVITHSLGFSACYPRSFTGSSLCLSSMFSVAPVCSRSSLCLYLPGHALCCGCTAGLHGAHRIPNTQLYRLQSLVPAVIRTGDILSDSKSYSEGISHAADPKCKF